MMSSRRVRIALDLGVIGIAGVVLALRATLGTILADGILVATRGGLAGCLLWSTKTQDKFEKI